MDRQGAYQLIAHTLRQFSYARLGKADKGLVRSFLAKVSGFSRAQLTHLIAQYFATGQLRDRRGPPAQLFARRYTRQDTALRAEVDTLAWHPLRSSHTQAV